MRASLCTNPKVLLIADIISECTDVGRRLSTGFNGALCEIVTCDVTRDITIASLLRVWCATNEHTEDGVWHNSTLRTIDQAAGIPGFGEAMALAGWAIYDEATNTVTMPNFLENNAPAKNNARSSGAERQARYRQKLKEKAVPRDVTGDVTVTSQSDTREEKRREEISPTTDVVGGGAKQRPTRKCPDSFEVTPSMRTWAAEHAPLVDLELATAKLRDHTFKTAITDWPGAWRNWLRKDQEFAESRQPKAAQHKPPAETFRERDERLAREKMAAFLPGIAARSPKDSLHVIDVTPNNVTEIHHGIPHQLGR